MLALAPAITAAFPAGGGWLRPTPTQTAPTGGLAGARRTPEGRLHGHTSAPIGSAVRHSEGLWEN